MAAVSVYRVHRLQKRLDGLRCGWDMVPKEFQTGYVQQRMVQLLTNDKDDSEEQVCTGCTKRHHEPLQSRSKPKVQVAGEGLWIHINLFSGDVCTHATPTTYSQSNMDTGSTGQSLT